MQVAFPSDVNTEEKGVRITNSYLQAKYLCIGIVLDIVIINPQTREKIRVVSSDLIHIQIKDVTYRRHLTGEIRGRWTNGEG